MTEKVLERKEIEEKYKWDLSTLFTDDDSWESALEALDEKISAVGSYSGRLIDADTIRQCLDDMYSLMGDMNNVFTYSFLRNSEDTRVSKAQSMYARAYGKYVQAMTASAFFKPQMLELGADRLKELMEEEQLAPYRFLLEDLLRMAPHTLSAKEEELLSSFGEALGAPARIAENLMNADLLFDDVKDDGGNTRELNDSTFILLQSDTDRTLRENAFRSFYKTYKNHINTFAAAYSGCVKGAVTNAKARGFVSSRQMSLAADNIPESVYDNLIETIHKRMDSMYRYVRLRKKILKLDELHYYDVYAPLASESRKHYTYEQAKELVLKAVSPLGQEYCAKVQEAFDQRWIDVWPNTGKQGGAYSSGTYTSNPYIMMNFTGTLDSVSTIAHEMGHSMHSWNTNHHQPLHYADYTMFVAEVASTVNENLLIEQLLKEEQEPMARLALLNQYLEGFKGTVYRQTMFAEFEKIVHEMSMNGESLDQAALCGVYRDLIALYFGEDLIIDDEVQYEWSRIPHFYSPFYVYVYATGYCTANALSQMILSEGQPAVKRYLEFLQMGSSRYPIDELIYAGVDLRTPEPIEKALDLFDRVLSEAERIAEEIA